MVFKPQNRDGYIPAIDGMRAIAVVLVLLFHVGLEAFAGGFIGVDVFFVISGYLITGIILRQGDDFSFSNFYKRRIKRLLPAMIVTVLATLAAGLILMNPQELKSLGQETVYASLSLANVLYWFDSGYFEAGSETKALLHTWSLGVEEQFYLVWPAIIFLTAKLGKPVLIAVVTVMFALSLAGAIMLQPTAPEAVFFLTPFRIFQFACGAIIAILNLRLGGRLGLLLAIIATLALVALSMSINGSTGTVLSAMLAPAVAAAALIVASSGSLVAHTIGSAPMTWIGQRSYSIYLCHWPIIVFWRQETGLELNLTESAVLFIASIVIGTLLHWLVEARFRWAKTSFREGMIHTALAVSIAGSVFAGAHAWALSAPRVSSTTDQPIIVTDTKTMHWDLAPYSRWGTCFIGRGVPMKKWDKDACFEMSDVKPNWLIIGDSYAGETYMLLKDAFPELNFVQANMAACPPLIRSAQSPQENQNCVDFADFEINELSQDDRLKGIVVSARWDRYTKDDTLPGLEETISHLEDSGKQVLITGQRPWFKVSIPKLYLDDPELSSELPRSEILPRVLSLEESLKDKFADIWIDMFEIQCPSNCPIRADEGQLLYRDGGHLSVSAKSYFREELREQVTPLIK
ncbi:acyltransferase family protein [Henriciella sp. AS95]|uniref:acyltransferase family protein n=1 Tax=Henriciella sp. AS95 TaxID=3135782 RepID=UPI0031730E6D